VSPMVMAVIIVTVAVVVPLVVFASAEGLARHATWAAEKRSRRRLTWIVVASLYAAIGVAFVSAGGGVRALPYALLSAATFAVAWWDTRPDPRSSS